jgi:hypothetical protein
MQHSIARHAAQCQAAAQSTALLKLNNLPTRNSRSRVQAMQPAHFQHRCYPVCHMPETWLHKHEQAITDCGTVRCWCHVGCVFVAQPHATLQQPSGASTHISKCTLNVRHYPTSSSNRLECTCPTSNTGTPTHCMCLPLKHHAQANTTPLHTHESSQSQSLPQTNVTV